MPVSMPKGKTCPPNAPTPNRAERRHPDATRFVSQDAAAERWGVSVDTIRRLIAAGKITGYRLNNRIIRVSLDEVDAAFQPIPTGR